MEGKTHATVLSPRRAFLGHGGQEVGDTGLPARVQFRKELAACQVCSRKERAVLGKLPFSEVSRRWVPFVGGTAQGFRQWVAEETRDHESWPGLRSRVTTTQV